MRCQQFTNNCLITPWAGHNIPRNNIASTTCKAELYRMMTCNSVLDLPLQCIFQLFTLQVIRSHRHQINRMSAANQYKGLFHNGAPMYYKSQLLYLATRRRMEMRFPTKQPEQIYQTIYLASFGVSKACLSFIVFDLFSFHRV